ncbi:hypothetical protein [Caballeronia sordidicola]|jgi:hypothetical protein|uniref:hypothetical protein n=1 Tax=Caballeronia sordidicola TaxID=196367 RepID=UPI0004CFF6F5|nr:hypothetical protein [Caballeronia sordidicola]
MTNWTRETLEQLAHGRSGVVTGEEDPFIEQQERAVSTHLEEITQAEYLPHSKDICPLNFSSRHYCSDQSNGSSGSTPAGENIRHCSLQRYVKINREGYPSRRY